MSGIDFQDIAEFRVPSRNISFIYVEGWERAWRMKKINPVLLLEMEVDSKAGRNGSHPVREQEELELDDSPEKGDYGGSLPLDSASTFSLVYGQEIPVH